MLMYPIESRVTFVHLSCVFSYVMCYHGYVQEIEIDFTVIMKKI